MYDFTQLTFFTNGIAFALTYLLHSTAWILLMFCIVKLPSFSTPLLRNYLWKAALIGGLLTSILIHFSGNSLLEIQLAKENKEVIASIQQPTVEEPLVQITPEDFVPIKTEQQVIQENEVRIPVPVESSKAENTPVKETASSFVKEKEIASTDFKIGPILLLLGFLCWGIGTLFFIGKETIRHFIFIKKIGTRTRINHPTFNFLLKQIRLKLGQRLTIDLSHSAILESPILIKNQEICLPEKALSKLKAPQIEAMLAHEMAHVVRKDYYWNCFLLVLDTLLFFQPLHRLAIKEIQTTNELLCDEWAAKIIGNNLALAQCLLTVATWMKTPAKSYPLVAGMSLKKSELSNRITSLINLPDMKKQRFNFLKIGLPFVAFLSMAIFVLPGFTFTNLSDDIIALTDNEDKIIVDKPYHQHTHVHVHVTDDEPTEKTVTSTEQIKESSDNQVNKNETFGTIGWAQIEQTVKERSREPYSQNDLSTKLKLEKFYPEELGVKVPFYAQHSQTFDFLELDPYDLDTPLKERRIVAENETIELPKVSREKVVQKESSKIPTILLEEKFLTNRNHPYFKRFKTVDENATEEDWKYVIRGVYFANLSCAGKTRQKMGGPLVTNRGYKNSLIFTLDYGDRIEYDTLQNCVKPAKKDTNNDNSELWKSFKVVRKKLNLGNTRGVNYDNNIKGHHPDVVESQWVQQSDNQKQTPIGIKLKDKADVYITVETTNGQPVLVIANGVLEAGVHEFVFPHVNIKKGTYRLVTTVDGETLSQNIRVKRTRFTNKKEKDSCAALLRAVKGNNTPKVKALLQNTDPNCEYREEGEPRSPLNAAARKGNVEIGKLLLAANADVEFRAKGDEGALMGAASKGHLDFVKLMVENGAKINKTVGGNGTALINAVRGGHYEVAEYLLEHGADPMLNVPGDENPILHALNQGDKMLDLVLKYRKSK